MNDFPSQLCGSVRRAGLVRGLAALSALLQSILLMASIVLLFCTQDRQISSACVMAWLLIALLERPSPRPWSMAIAGMLMLNVRQVILDEGTLPASHMDGVLIIAAFVCGHRRSSFWWARCAACVAIAVLIAVVINLEIVFDFAWFGIEYHAQALTKNQTALLAGLGSLCALFSLQNAQRWSGRGLYGMALLANLVLLRAADSRAGVLMGVVALGLAGLLAERGRLVQWASKLARGVRRATPLLCVALLILMIASALTLWLPSGLGPTLPTSLDHWYGEENLENDASRLKIYSCYLGLPFTGNNRFIWGVGYGNAWSRLCTAKEVGRSLSHSHNLVLQVWAETGILGVAFLLTSLAWILLRVILNSMRLSGKRPSQITQESSQLFLWSSGSYVYYLLLFNMVELGMVKVPLLMFLFGLFLASPFQLDGRRPSGV